jgi:hypothetical protein
MQAALDGDPGAPASAASPRDPSDVTMTRAPLTSDNPNAPVYDRFGNLCPGVPAIPPPSPSCYGEYDNCPTTPPTNCVLSRVICPSCPAPPPTMPPPPPTPPANFKAALPPFPPVDDPFAECGYPVTNLMVSNVAGGPISLAARLDEFEVDSLPGCFKIDVNAGPPGVGLGAFPVGWRPDFWKRLKQAERNFCQSNPFVCADFYLASRIAIAETQSRWKGKPNRFDDGEENAFQHAFWNAMMAWGHGKDLAKQMGDAHENFTGNRWKHKWMDSWNNSIGRDIGQAARANPQITWTTIAEQVFQSCVVQHSCRWLSGPNSNMPPPVPPGETP